MKPLLPISIRYACALVLFILLTQCRHVEPQPPKAEGFDQPLTPAKSYVVGSVIFPLRLLEDKINRELDTVLVGRGIPGTLFPFRVARSGRVQIQYANQQVQLSTPLQLWIAKPFSNDTIPPDKPFCSLQINFQSPLNVTPEWRLASQVRFTDYDWVIKPQIRLLGKEISLANLVQKLLQTFQPGIEAAIDGAIYQELRLDQIVAPIWKDIQQPLQISKQYGLWLLPKPLAVESSPITGDKTKIIAHLRITFDTKTAIQLNKPSYSPSTLPKLQKQEQLPQTAVLRLMSSVPYADINQVIQSTIAQDPPKLALGTLTVKHVSVYGGQRSLIVKTELDGLVDGTVYLRGRPVFDTLTNTLTIKHLDFDTDTEAVLPAPLRSLIHKGLVNVLDGMLTIRLADDIRQFPDKISKAFASGGTGKKAQLLIQTFRFVPQQLAVRPTGVQTLIRVESKVAVQMKKL